MTNFFLILIISIIFSFWLFDLKFKKGFNLKKRSKKSLTFLIFFIVSLSVGVFVTYNYIGFPNYSEELLKSNKKNQLKSKEDLKNKIIQTKKNIIFLEKEVLTSPNNSSLLLLLASNYAIIGDNESEIQTLSKILKFENNSTVKSLLAQALLKKNKGIVGLKIKNLTLDVIQNNPKDEGANFILGLYYEQIGDMQTAQKIWSKLLLNLKKDSPFFLLVKKKLSKVID